MTFRKRSLIALAIICLAPVSCSKPTSLDSAALDPAPSSPGHHSVVILLMSGLRTDSLGSYEAGSRTTPNLDAFADSAVRFDWAFAQAPDRVTSLASLLTGLYPTTHGLVETGDRLVDEAETLAELVSGAGLSTAAFFADAAPLDQGLAQGFEHLESGPQALESAVAWLEQHAGKELLAVVDLGAIDDSTIDTSDAPASHAAHVSTLDAAAGRVLGAIDSAATIAVVSLTGFDLGEHGEPGSSNIWAPVTHVPVLLRSTRLGSTGAVDKFVELIDLGPTLLDLLGEASPPQLQGKSLLPLIAGNGTPPYVAFGESPAAGGRYYAALGGYRLVRHEAEDINELYNIEVDPEEKADLSETEASRVTVLLDHLDAWRKMSAAASLDPERRTEELDDETLEQLRSLGYIQ